jgi:hypothetical protein
MTIRITIDIFSGRPNPVLELTGRAATEALKRLRITRRLSAREPMRLPPILGYRGLIIEQVGKPAPGLPRLFQVGAGGVRGQRLARSDADEDFEDFVCGSVGKLHLEKRFPEFLRREMTRAREVRATFTAWKPPIWPSRIRCACAPLYEPGWWNDGWGGQRQPNNNCYNYGSNYRTDTFAQPGRAAGAQYTALTCASVLPAAMADALLNSPGANNRCPPEGHLVALVIAPGWDFHWYRKGRNGYWSHKPGGTQVTNVDNSGHLIPDPRTADRGPYTDFCTFMVVMHGHVKIN